VWQIREASSILAGYSTPADDTIQEAPLTRAADTIRAAPLPLHSVREEWDGPALVGKLEWVEAQRAKQESGAVLPVRPASAEALPGSDGLASAGRLELAEAPPAKLESGAVLPVRPASAEAPPALEERARAVKPVPAVARQDKQVLVVAMPALEGRARAVKPVPAVAQRARLAPVVVPAATMPPRADEAEAAACLAEEAGAADPGAADGEGRTASRLLTNQWRATCKRSGRFGDAYFPL